jgi:transposase, IS30 family
MFSSISSAAMVPVTMSNAGASTKIIARELKRNTGSKVGYQPTYAQAQASARRWSGSRLERDDTLRETILNRLGASWSPEQIVGRLTREEGHKVISHETIYRFVYAQLMRPNDTAWRFDLPRAKHKRGWCTKGGWPRNEGKSSIHDRHSRITFALVLKNLKSDPIAHSLTQMREPFAPQLCQSITFDKGTEFSRHENIASKLGINIYFCNPRATRQKGGIENAIGRLRRALPTKIDLATLPQDRLNAIIPHYNHTPRKCIGFKTPAEIFNPLHFQCESTGSFVT